MYKVSDGQYLASEQYRDSEKLRARTALFERFSTNKQDFARWMFSHLEAPARARVLELGSGPATLWIKNRERIPTAWHITLTDLSPGMVQEADEALEGLPGSFELHIADAQALPFERASFDTVIANHMLFHVLDIPGALTEVQRVLKPGGRFYATTNGRAHLHELHAFVYEHLLKPLEPEAAKPESAGRFTLEDAPQLPAPYFERVATHSYPNHLEITDTDALLSSVRSWESWRSVTEPVTQEQVIREAREVLEQKLARGPFHVTQSSGLLIAS